MDSKQSMKASIAQTSIAQTSIDRIASTKVTPKTTHADFIITILSKLGLDTAFGIPGGFIEPLLNSLAKSTNFTTIIAKHESGAAMMCDGYYRKVGKMALCFSTTGPGITNMLTGISCAYQDNIPMIIITPLNSSENHGRGALQDSSRSGVDVVSMLSSCTVYNEVVTHPSQLIHKLHAAYVSALLGTRKGPANLCIPVEILRNSCELTAFNTPFNIKEHKLLASDEQINAVVDLIHDNHKVIFVYGEQARGSKLAEFIGLAVANNANIVEVPMSKGSIPHTLPLYKGVYGFAGHETATKAIDHADLIICLGVDLNEVSTKTWSGKILSNQSVVITDSLGTITRSQGVKLAFLCDVDLFIEGLTSRLSTEPLPRHIQTRNLKTDFIARMMHSNPAELDRPIKPSLFFALFSALCPADTEVFFDSGNSFVWGVNQWKGNRSASCTKKLCHSGFGFASMGWAIGAAVGAGIGSDDLVVCVTGDGSMLMAGQEITTAYQARAKVIFVVLNDSGYGMVKHGQRLAKAEQVCFELPEINFADMAHAMGIKSYIVRTPMDLAELPFGEICNSNEPVLIDVRIDGEEVPPMGDRMRALSSGDSSGDSQ